LHTSKKGDQGLINSKDFSSNLYSKSV